MGKRIDLTGKRYGYLTVLGFETNDKNGSPKWRCLCDCGNECVVYGSCLRYGITKSCGCKTQKLNSEQHKTHGLSNTKLYHVFQCMKDRCYNKSAKAYIHYGARGITICDDWMNDFTNFYKWAIESGYQDGLSIDRIDVNGNYCPENCRWATPEEQANNQRNNHLISYNGETHNVTQWASILNIPRKRLYNRIREGLSLEEILAT